jgi:uncharacterized membrane protein YfcA
MMSFADLDLQPGFLLALGAVALAGLVRGFAGFGSAMVMIPALSVLYGPTRAVPLGLILEIIVSAPFVPAVRHQVNWRRMAILSAGGLLALPLGVAALMLVPPTPIRIAMSVLIVGFVGVLAFGWRYTGKPTDAATAGTGFLSGFLNGVVGMAGPPVVFFLLSGPYAAAEVRASTVVYFAVVDLGAVIVLWLAGAVGVDLARDVVLLAPVYLLAAWAGAHGFRHAGDALYRKVALGILVLVAVGSLFG